jgi:hypothetical protein
MLTVLALILAGLSPLTLSASAQPLGGVGVKLVDLRVERKTEPVGIDLDHPRFSWIISTAERDVRQESFRVQVTTGEEVVWDSGVVESDRSFDVEYDGPSLASTTGYEWTVDVVTTAGEASGSFSRSRARCSCGSSVRHARWSCGTRWRRSRSRSMWCWQGPTQLRRCNASPPGRSPPRWGLRPAAVSDSTAVFGENCTDVEIVQPAGSC